MASNDFKMKYVIDADASKAKAAFNDLDKRIGGITSSIGSLGGLSGTAIAGALTGIATAGAAVGAAMFQMTKSASEFGSTIYDASVKTGLGATSISALKLAADQSGSSLEAITGGVAKFAKTVGAAGEGSKEAAAKLKSLGIEPVAALNDLDGSLAKVFKRIGEAKPGIEQITLAQKAFGKSGADLLTVMDQVGYDLEAFRKRAEELGITIDDKAARAADEFGDQMTELEAQLAGVGRTIGFELMSVFKDMATYMSTWLSNNKGEIQSWGMYVADILRGVGVAWDVAADAAKRYAQAGAFGAVGAAVANGDNSSELGKLSNFSPWGILGMMGKNSRPASIGALRQSDDTRSYNPPKGFGSDIGGGSGGSKKSPKEVFKLGTQGRAFVKVAEKLGISPLDLATIVGFETGGTYSTSIDNGKGYIGLSQFGKSEQKQFGAFKGQGFEAQLEAMGRFLTSRFAGVGRSTAGASLIDLYRTVLGGNPNASLTGKDANGTSPMSGVQNMLRTHRPAALKKFFGGSESNAKGGEWGKSYSGFENEGQKEADEETAGLMAAWNEFRDWEEQQVSNRLQTRQAEAGQAIEILQGQLREQMIDEVDYADRVGQLRIDMLEDERDEVEKLTPTSENLHRLDLLRLEIGTARVKKENDVADAVERQNKAFLDQLDALAGLKKKNQRPGGLKKRGEGSELEDFDIFGAFDPDKMKDATQIAADQMKTLKDMANDTFGSMASAIGQSIAAWALYGDSIGASLQKATAAILANLAAQAITQAVWETAQGFAMLALSLFGNPGAGAAAVAHFQAAAIYATIGAGAALGAKAVGGGGKGAASGGGSGSGSSYDPNAGPSTYSRVSPDAFMSGERRQANSLLEIVLNKLHDKINAMRPGDVLVNGMRQKPGVVGAQVVSDVKRNSGTGRDLGRSMGIR
ncbi:MAG: hypothetical protein IPL32_19915 [Chloracidobacterium sp.]|nr:hypothetical protein [Chloracidobacterium sp.]